MPVPLTCEPGGVDVVCAVAVAAGAEEDPVAVGGQQVGAAVLALVADLQRSAVLRLTSVVRAHKLTRKYIILLQKYLNQLDILMK